MNTARETRLLSGRYLVVVLSVALILGYVLGGAAPAHADDVGVQPYAYWVQASGDYRLYDCAVGSSVLSNAYGLATVGATTAHKEAAFCGNYSGTDNSTYLIAKLQPVYYIQGNGPYACPGGLIEGNPINSHGPTHWVQKTYLPNNSGAATPCKYSDGYSYMHGYTFQVISFHTFAWFRPGYEEHNAILASGGLSF